MEDWYSVDKGLHPAYGTLCWVTDGIQVWLARREKVLTWEPVERDILHIPRGPVLAWQEISIPPQPSQAWQEGEKARLIVTSKKEEYARLRWHAVENKD